MPDNYKNILRAITALATAAQNLTPPTGDVAETVAKKAKVSRATLYRYLGKYTGLQTSYNLLKGPTHRVPRSSSFKSANPEDAFEVIENLKKEVAALKEERDEISRTKNSQILLLWTECRRLRQLSDDPSAHFSGNISELRKRDINPR
jgi:transposase